MKVYIYSLLLIFTFVNPGNDLALLTNLNNMTYTYLALGDSYTIGEQVPAADNYPSQAVQMLRKKGVSFYAPEIIAKTGWTTDELQSAINEHQFLEKYDFVSLLIGVNNQYRGRPVTEFEEQFEVLLKKAIQFAGNDRSRVIIISIPDWGVTPFAEANLPDKQGRDRKQITTEIDAYNNVCKNIANKYSIHYIYITDWTREAASDHSLLTADGLHPSGKEYERWAELISTHFHSKL
ncbi:MAG: SGNH/GDSL hydrolase family protein [Chitinophagaceae bacterium]|nr:SGNH/GDSL hydrolase family protein [Chitinophagaceae bacterium]